MIRTADTQAEQILATQQQPVLTDVRLGFYDVPIAQRRREMTEQLVIDRAYAEPIPNVDVQAVIQSDNGTGSSNVTRSFTAR